MISLASYSLVGLPFVGQARRLPNFAATEAVALQSGILSKQNGLDRGAHARGVDEFLRVMINLPSFQFFGYC